jgi:hypothetical protein
VGRKDWYEGIKPKISVLRYHVIGMVVSILLEDTN